MDSGYGFRQHLRWNLDLFGLPFDTGDPNSCTSFGNPCYVEDSTWKNAASIPISRFQQPRENVPNDPRNWFNHMPYFYRPFDTEFNSASNEKLYLGPYGMEQPESPKIHDTALGQQRYLVFDQSGDKMTLMCGTGVVKTPIQVGVSWSPNPSNLKTKSPLDDIYPLSLTLADGKVDENSRDISGDEMHEDTEELNALLYSDSDYTENDEETSTGHSPSTMTDNYTRNLIEETCKEVNIFAGTTKRQKLENGGYYGTLTNVQTASPSRKTLASSSLESDAESSCGSNGNNLSKVKRGSSFGVKRSRKEKIRDTVSLLQCVIPGAKGKIAIDVIDEAINYLRCLKVNAKALGLGPI